MNDFKQFTSEEMLKLINFYINLPRIRLTEIIIERMPIELLREVLETDDAAIRKFKESMVLC